MLRISLVVITRNEAQNIVRCLESASAVSDEMIVVDAHSTDETRELAAGAGARVLVRDWDSYSGAKNFGNRQASHPMILSLDADEALSEELTKSILAVKNAHSPGTYKFNRLTRFGDRWIRHGAWYPDVKIRLFSREDFHWSGEVHETLVNKNRVPIAMLNGHLLHYSYNDEAELAPRQRHYARLAAEALHARGATAGWGHLYLKPAIRFIRDYVLRRGFLDGRRGWIISLVTARAVHWKYIALRTLYLKDQG